MLIYPEVGLSWAEVPEAERQRYESRAAAYWDSFYKKNENKFYKDRHYFDREFPELLHGPLRVMEVRGSSCMHQAWGLMSGAVLMHASRHDWGVPCTCGRAGQGRALQLFHDDETVLEIPV